MYDVIVVGGGIAGMSAALNLGRARRRVLVLDAGSPRNQPASHSHGFVTQDGMPPLELLRVAREQLQAYPTIEVVDAAAIDAESNRAGIRLTLANGSSVEARRLMLATGVRDELPEIPGMSELWGNGVYHCPYCHGYEVRDRAWALLGAPKLAYERAALFRGWTRDLVLLTEGAAVDPETFAQMRALGVSVEERAIRGIEKHGDDVDVRFEDGVTLTVGGVFIAARQEQRSRLPGRLGCELDYFEPMDSHYVKVDAATSETSVPGVYAAGDMTGPSQSLVLAAAGAARAAYAINRSLALEEARNAIAMV